MLNYSRQLKEQSADCLRFDVVVTKSTSQPRAACSHVAHASRPTCTMPFPKK